MEKLENAFKELAGIEPDPENQASGQAMIVVCGNGIKTEPNTHKMKSLLHQAFSGEL